MENKYYLISDLVQFTGLSDRTLRNYISAEILRGEKQNGIWNFSLEQVESFIRHPAVRPSILAKQNAAVYDFLLDQKRTASEMCVILDLPEKSEDEITAYFCDCISKEHCQNVHFTCDGVTSVPRVILKGNTAEVLRLINGYENDF